MSVTRRCGVDGNGKAFWVEVSELHGYAWVLSSFIFLRPMFLTFTNFMLLLLILFKLYNFSASNHYFLSPLELAACRPLSSC
jgi:hypothetical protein